LNRQEDINKILEDELLECQKEEENLENEKFELEVKLQAETLKKCQFEERAMVAGNRWKKELAVKATLSD
jgi:hypothetical protein